MELLIRICGDQETFWTWQRWAPALGAHNLRREHVKLALAAVLGVTVLDIACKASARGTGAHSEPVRDYRDRSGFPSGLESARSNARPKRPGSEGAVQVDYS